jgi:alkylhydroperoxidase/carboxymuconolactone decarboxylase family protein YurZ
MDRIQHVGRLARALAPRNLESLESHLAETVPEHLPQQVAYEILLQSYLFFGYAQAIEAAKIYTRVAAAKRVPAHSPKIEEPNIGVWRSRGQQLCRKIYAPNYERLVANMAEVSPELALWMVDEGYGKVLSRPGPTEREREVASIIFLAISGHPVQLFSHVRGAKNLGVGKSELVSLVEGAGLNETESGLILTTIERVFAA